MIVTSFGPDGYVGYGKRFIRTFLENVSDEKLVIYYEEKPTDLEVHERIEWRDLYSVEGIAETLTTFQNCDDIFQGLRAEGNKKAYDYRYDAFRFCRKVFAICDAVLSCDNEQEPIAWIDADVIFHSPVPNNFLESLIVNDEAIVYLGRDWFYSECGFVLFNLADPQLKEFMKVFKAVYTTGAFRFLGQWHDCYVFDFLRTVTEIKTRNLAEGITLDHVFINTVLGKYMDHLKGPQRKKEGGSKKHEGAVNSDIDYWQNKKTRDVA